MNPTFMTGPTVAGETRHPDGSSHRDGHWEGKDSLLYVLAVVPTRILDPARADGSRRGIGLIRLVHRGSKALLRPRTLHCKVLFMTTLADSALSRQASIAGPSALTTRERV